MIWKISNSLADSLGETRSNWRDIGVSGVLLVAVLVGDLFSPLGLAAAFLYLPVILLAGSSSRSWHAIAVGLISTIFTALGLALSPEGLQLWAALVNRLFSVAAIWLAVGLTLQHRKMRRQTREMQHTEGVLQESQSRLNNILDNADAVIISVDQEQRVTAFNGAAERVFGYSSEEVIGEPLEILIPPRFRSAHQGHVRAFAKGQPTNRRMNERGDIFGLRKDGTEFPAEAAISKLGTDGEGRMTVFLVDITERRQYEQALLALEAEQRHLAQENAAISDIGRIVSSTLNLDELFQRLSGEVAKHAAFDRININIIDYPTGRYVAQFISGIDWPRRQAGDALPLAGSRTEHIIKTGETLVQADLDPAQPFDYIPEYENLGLRASISVPIWSRGVIIGTLNLRSKEIGAYGEPEKLLLERIARQVAPAIENAGLYERSQRLAEALQRRAADLARSNAELEQFAYVASHDLQEPLRSIAGFTRLLARHHLKEDDEEAHQYVGRVVNATNRMQGLINDLLDYSRVGRNVTDFTPVSSEEALSLALGALAAALEEAGAEITHDPLPQVTADLVLLTQLFQNLVSNCVKFRGQAPLKIHVSAVEVPDEWVFSVADNGIGISPEYFERVFAIFQRLHTRDQYPGSGIGLSICKKAVERLGGRIWVESQPDEGSTFYFTVPFTVPASVSPGLDIASVAAPHRSDSK